jgi:hypothetical protein
MLLSAASRYTTWWKMRIRERAVPEEISRRAG